MNACALVLVHDEVPGRGAAEVGTVAPALTGLGFEVLIATFLAGGPPIPIRSGSPVLVVLGSAAAADDDSLPWLGPERAYLDRSIELGVPVLGICFGGQLLARVLGGTVGRAARPERGFVPLTSADRRCCRTRMDAVPRRHVHPAAGRRAGGGQRDRRAGVPARPARGRAVPSRRSARAAFAAWMDAWRVTGELDAGGGRGRPARSRRRGRRPRRASAAACRDLVHASGSAWGSREC